MKTPAAALAAVLCLGAAAPGQAQDRKQAEDLMTLQTATASIVAPDGRVLGAARFEETPNAGVLISVEVEGLPPGGHGLHLHSVGACEPDFQASSGHVNHAPPAEMAHGLRNPKGPDIGDLPNLFAAADGSARAEFFTRGVMLADRRPPASEPGGEPAIYYIPPALLDEDGSALVIHENPDDHLTQPIGGAGGRIACGVLEASP